MPGGDAWPADPRDRLRLREAESDDAALLVYRDASDAQCIVRLPDDAPGAVIGRGEENDVAIAWDDRVSRTHAQLTRVGRRWHVEDDGISRNGTYVNEDRIVGRRPLEHGDVIRVGRTRLTFRAAGGSPGTQTAPESRLTPPPPLPPGQRRVLEALCRPCLAPGGPHAPASNEQIASELHLSVDAVKAQLRLLFRRFEIEDLSQIQKRTALVRIAIESGVLRSGA